MSVGVGVVAAGGTGGAVTPRSFHREAVVSARAGAVDGAEAGALGAPGMDGGGVQVAREGGSGGGGFRGVCGRAWRWGRGHRTTVRRVCERCTHQENVPCWAGGP